MRPLVFYNHTVNLNIDSIYNSVLQLVELKCTPAIVKHNKDLRNKCRLTTATEITQTGYSTKKNIFRLIN